MRRLLPLLAVSAFAVAAAPAEAAKRMCGAKGSVTEAQNRYARLYRTAGGRLVACVKPSGRRVVLDRNYDDGYVTSSSWSRPTLAGRHAAWVSTYTDVSCKAACPPQYEATRSSIVVYDMRRRRSVQTVSGDFDYVLTDRGALAWLVMRDGGAELHTAVAGAGQRVVDAGAISSLRAYYSLVLWTRDGEPRWTVPGAR